MNDVWQVHALKYAERNTRTRADSFVFDDDHAAPHPMDYFIWVLRCGRQTILVDTGYDSSEASGRARPILRDPAAALADIGIRADDISTIVVTHLHYDHAGGLSAFPGATLHLQAAEMAYATGPCMCHDVLRMPYTAGHVCDAVQRVHAGQVVFHDGDGQVADGVTVHRLGGHSRGLQAVRVRTKSGWLCLASDASHFYENLFSGVPFPIVVDVQAMLDGFQRLLTLADDPALVIPGHDPMVTELFPQDGAAHVFRLDDGPIKRFPFSSQ